MVEDTPSQVRRPPWQIQTFNLKLKPMRPSSQQQPRYLNGQKTFYSHVVLDVLPFQGAWGGKELPAGVFFTITLFQKRILKIQSSFFSPRTLLADKTKRKFLARPVFNLKTIDLGAFFNYFHLLSTLKWYNFPKLRQSVSFLTSCQTKKNRLKIPLQVSNLALALMMP